MLILAQIVGRQGDLVVRRDGRRSTRFDWLFKEFPEILEAQVFQEAVTRLRVHGVAPGGLSTRTVQTIRRWAHTRLIHEVEVHVERVEAGPRTEAGEFLSVVNLIGSKAAP